MNMFVFELGMRWDVVLASSFKKAVKKFMWRHIDDPDDWEDFSKKMEQIPSDQPSYEQKATIVALANRYIIGDINWVGEASNIEAHYSGLASDTEALCNSFQRAAFDKIEKDLL